MVLLTLKGWKFEENVEKKRSNGDRGAIMKDFDRPESIVEIVGRRYHLMGMDPERCGFEANVYDKITYVVLLLEN